MHPFLQNKLYLKDTGVINAVKVCEKYIKINYNDLYIELISFSKEHNLILKNFSRLIWHYINNIQHIPICIVCKEKENNFISISSGYRNTCGKVCSNKSDSHINSIKNSNFKKYGVINPNKLDSVKNKIKQQI